MQNYIKKFQKKRLPQSTLSLLLLLFVFVYKYKLYSSEFCQGKDLSKKTSNLYSLTLYRANEVRMNNASF